MIHQELLQTTKQLIAIPSTADRPHALLQAVDLIANMLEPYPHITVERFMVNNVPSLLAYAGNKRPERFDVLFNGHVDVVPGTPSQFIPVHKNDRLYGRGVYDMKMAAVLLTNIFRQHAGSSPVKMGLQIVADEEVGGVNGVKYQIAKGVKTDFAVFGEMTDLKICTETRGVCWMEIGFKGKSAHSGYAWEGHNAVVQASDLALALLAKFPLPKNRAWTTTVNISAISTDNGTYNRVPDTATLKMDFRFTPEDPDFKNLQAVEALIKRMSPAAIIQDVSIFDQAVFVKPTNPYLQTFRQAFTQATDEPPELIRRYASSDTRHFAVHGMDCIEFGLSGKNLHADDEYVDLTSVTPFCNTIEHFLSLLATQNHVVGAKPAVR